MKICSCAFARYNVVRWKTGDGVCMGAWVWGVRGRGGEDWKQEKHN